MLPQKTNDLFYEKLEEMYDKAHNNDIKIIIGDFNAEMREKKMRTIQPFVQPTSQFQKSIVYGRTQNQIEHHDLNVMDVRSCRGLNIDSDHYLVRVVLRPDMSCRIPQATVSAYR